MDQNKNDKYARHATAVLKVQPEERIEMQLRTHQEELRKYVSDLKESSLPARVVAWVVPGGGKSILPGIVKGAFRNLKIGWFVPRLSLARQAAESMHNHFNLELREGEIYRPSRDADGFVATHQLLVQNVGAFEDEFRRNDYILVFDELHHAKLKRDETPEPTAAALRRLRYKFRLDMTGTLDTADNCKIDGIDYDLSADGWTVKLDSPNYKLIRYSRDSALTDLAIVKIDFYHHDGKVEFINGGRETSPVVLSETDKQDEYAAIWTALNTDFAEQLFLIGVDHWRDCGKKLIVVTDSQSNAKKYAKRLRDMHVKTSLAIDDNEDAHSEILSFRGQNTVNNDALVTCQMAYEGLDVPEASHLICLTHIRSTPWIEQMLGRVWRRIQGKEKCYAFVPDDPRMNRVIELIRQETPQMISPKECGGGGGGGGGERDGKVVAISGSVESQRVESLDGFDPVDELKSDIVYRLKQYLGEGCYDAIVQDAISKACAKQRATPARPYRTLSERETDIRNQIAKSCRRLDSDKGVEFGTHQSALFKRTGKSTTKMTEEELKHAAAIVSRF